MGGGRPGTEAPVALHVERQTLDDTADVADAITAALEHLEPVVEPLNKAPGLVVDEVVGDEVLPGVQQLQELVAACEPALDHALAPKRDTPQSIGLQRAVSKRRVSSSRRACHGNSWRPTRGIH